MRFLFSSSSCFSLVSLPWVSSSLVRFYGFHRPVKKRHPEVDGGHFGILSGQFHLRNFIASDPVQLVCADLQIFHTQHSEIPVQFFRGIVLPSSEVGSDRYMTTLAWWRDSLSSELHGYIQR